MIPPILIYTFQIISPHDEGISQSIKANLEPKTWDIQITSPLCIDKTAEMKEAYFANLLNAMSIAPYVHSLTSVGSA